MAETGFHVLAGRSVGQGHEMRKCTKFWFCVLIGLLAVLQFSGGCSLKQVSENRAENCDVDRREAESPEVDAFSSIGDESAEEGGESGLPDSGCSVSGTLADARIVIVKRERRLRLYSGDRLIRAYPVSLGRDPVGDKVRAGDCRTPEGQFYVCVKNPQSRFHLSLGISYPSREDADRGLRSGLITRSEYDAIMKSVDKGRIPPWNTALGGEIFIHGGGAGVDWTLGCIAMRTVDVEELYAAVPVGTSVVIQ
jgi:hypothetical protein